MRNTGPASIWACWCTFRKSTYGERPGGTARASGTSAARLTKTWLGSIEAGAGINEAELASELDSEQLRHQICVELDPLSRVRSGDKATLWLDAERIHLFDPHSGDNLTRATESTGRHAATTG